MIPSHSWCVFVKFGTHFSMKFFGMKFMKIFLWESFTNIIKRTDSIWTIFTFCNPHSLKLANKSNKFPFFRINFSFVRIQIKMFVFIFLFPLCGSDKMNKQSKLIWLHTWLSSEKMSFDTLNLSSMFHTAWNVSKYNIWSEYRKIRTRKNSVFRHFSRSVSK